MSSPTISGHIIGHADSKYHQPCFPCGDASAAASSISPSSTTSMEAEDEPNIITPPQPQEQATNVGELMTKAKKAAASLWVILHAQNCRQPQGRCPHRSCDETKVILIHVKTCHAGPNSPCPCNTKGCNETRKLLAHYRRCKDLRLKQVGFGRRSNGSQTEQACLVCSLMARYAKNMVEKHRSQGVGRSSNNAASLLADTLSSSYGSTGAKFNVENDFATFPTEEKNTSCTAGVQKLRGLERNDSTQLMPPPPPRQTSVPPDPDGDIHICNANESLGSPPTPSILMHSRLVKIAGITDPEAQDSLSDPVMLGKSVDSSVQVVPFPILRKSSREGTVVEELAMPSPNLQRRVRAESYDERKVKFAATVTSRHYYPAPQEDNHFSVPNPLAGNNAGRPRSASCGNMNHNRLSSSSLNGCDTIVEDEEHEGVFP